MKNGETRSIPEEVTRHRVEGQLKRHGAVETTEGRLEITREQLERIRQEMINSLRNRPSGELLSKSSERLSKEERIPQQEEITRVIMVATGVGQEDLKLTGGTLDANGNPITLYFELEEKLAQEKYGAKTEFAYMIEGEHPRLGGSMYTSIDRIHPTDYADESGTKDYEYGVEIARNMKHRWWQPIM